MKKTLIAAALAATFTLTANTAKAQGEKEKAVLENIMTRASVRSFQERPVEAEKVETLLRAAMAAPTDRNQQPWHFVVLNTSEAVARFAGDGEKAQRLKKTPLIVVVCADTTRMMEGERRDVWIQDLSAASENLLLAAHAIGLGAVWTTVYPLEAKMADVRHKLNLPANLIPLNAIRIGYPNPERPAEPKDKWDEKKITYGAFGD